ncbi:hypothetical protein ACSNOI_03370 [Actinomadura kijaniata]
MIGLQAAELWIGRSAGTLRRWGAEGHLACYGAPRRMPLDL